jgi:DNA-binding NarL/FixJ family response regulator
MRVKVLLVDDHAVVREGYRKLLERTSDIQVVAESADAEDAYRAFCSTSPDVVVMDVNLPGASGIEVTRRIVARDASARVLVFSMHDDCMFVTRALQAGARGYVTKGSAPEVLVQAVQAVACGKPYLSQDVAQHLALQALPGQPLPLKSLSPREFEVFRLLAEGRSVAEIARMMCLSQKTVANHQSNIRNKLELTNNAQVIRLAMSYGLVT